MEKKRENPHSGHRKRMRERFRKNGLNGWSEHEILEFLLFYVHSQRNTNDIGHSLVKRFGSLKGVLDADYEELLTVPGIGEQGAALLKFIPQLVRIYMTQSGDNCISTYEQRKEYFRSRLCTETAEIMLAACLDDKMKVCNCQEITRGTASRMDVQMQELLRIVLQTRCTKVILSHNHPKGTAEPSNADMIATHNIGQYLHSVGVELVDHVIVAGSQAISMEETGRYQRI